MSCIVSTKVLSLALLLFEFCLVPCLFANYKRINIKDFVKPKKLNDPNNVFVLFDGLSDKDIGEMVKDPDFQAFLDKVDGVRNLKKYDSQNSLESSRHSQSSDDSRSGQIQDEEGHFLRNHADAFSGDSSKSTTSSESSDADAIDRFINKTYREAMDGVKYSIDKSSNPQRDRMVMNSSISKMLESWPKPEHQHHKQHNLKIIIHKGNHVHKQAGPQFSAKFLRKGSFCSKGASKACTRACKSVLKGVCHDYKCSSGMKSRFKKECGINCRAKFS